MTLVPLKIPPGAYRNGTEYEAKGRWRDVNLVRWHEGPDTQPVGGWQAYSSLPEGFVVSGFNGYSPTPTLGDPVGCISYVDNSEVAYIVWSDGSDIVSITGSTFDELTPGGFTTANAWVQFDTFGEIPVLCGEADGRLWEWDNASSAVTQVTNSPTGNIGLVVTDERFIFALQKRRVEWCDRDDRTVWTAAATNQAGGFDLDTDGELLFGKQMRGEVLLVGTRDCWVARYIGAPNVWEFRRIGRTSALGGVCGVRVDDRAFWMGRDGFYMYSAGHVDVLPCDVWEYVVSDMVDPTVYSAAARGTFGWHNIAFNEVTWHYRSSSGSRKDRYVSYNYVNGTWSYGQTPFGAVAETNAFDKPLGLTEPDDGSGTIGFDDTFSSDQGWTLGTNWQITGGNLNQTTPAASSASLDISVWAANTDVWLTVIISGHTTGNLTVTFGTTTSNISGNGTYVAVLTSDSSPETLTFTADGTWDGDIGRVWLTRVPIMEMETGYVHHYVDTEYAKTGPLEIGDGERRAHITRVIPDEQDAGELSLIFEHREYPTSTETTETTVTAANPTDVRFSGRQLTLKVQPSTTGVDWRSGVHRLEVKPGGKR